MFFCQYKRSAMKNKYVANKYKQTRSDATKTQKINPKRWSMQVNMSPFIFLCSHLMQLIFSHPITKQFHLHGWYQYSTKSRAYASIPSISNTFGIGAKLSKTKSCGIFCG